jgi:DNA polymerase-3 subunit gamma/tau
MALPSVETRPADILPESAKPENAAPQNPVPENAAPEPDDRFDLPPVDAYDDAPPAENHTEPPQAENPQQPASAPEQMHDETRPIRNFEDLVKFANDRRDRLAVFALERHVRPVRCEWGQLEIALTEDADPELPQILVEKLLEWTGERWVVAVIGETRTLSVHESRAERRASLIEDARGDPLVAGVLGAFPGAEIVEVRERDDDQSEDQDPAEDAETEQLKQSKEN